jgi:ubiquinone/menaquinone biosynthesis C-methylase UbiE
METPTLAEPENHAPASENQQDTSIPGYSEWLSDLHEARDGFFRSQMEKLPALQSDRVLDVACGDGYFGALLRARVSVNLTCFDANPAYLKLAKSRMSESEDASPVA